MEAVPWQTAETTKNHGSTADEKPTTVTVTSNSWSSRMADETENELGWLH